MMFRQILRVYRAKMLFGNREHTKESVASMKYFLASGMLALLLMGSGDQDRDAVYEWRLEYMEWKIPEGTEGPATTLNILDLTKHKKEYQERAAVSVFTKGKTPFMVKSSSQAGILHFAVMPDGKGNLKIVSDFQENLKVRNGPSVARKLEAKDIVYDSVIELGGSANTRESKIPGKIGKGEAVIFVLSIRKTNREIPQMMNETPVIRDMNRTKEGEIPKK